MPDMEFLLAEQMPMKGSRHGRGWRYGGQGSETFTQERMLEAARRFHADGHATLALAARVFLRTCTREGYISAINTWDGQVLTWGVGFARGAINRRLWPELDSAVRDELVRLLPRRFDAHGIQVDDSVRTDEPALAALIHVAETDPYRDSVLRSQFKLFCTHTLGIDGDHAGEDAGVGAEYPSHDDSLVYFASRLRHYLPASFRLPRDLHRALELAGGPDDPTAFVAACIRIFAENLTRSDRLGADAGDGHRVLRAGPGARFRVLSKWRRRLAQFARQDHAFVLSDTSRRLVPGWTSPTPPFFTTVRRLDDLPPGRLVLREHDQLVDVGPRP